MAGRPGLGWAALAYELRERVTSCGSVLGQQLDQVRDRVGHQAPSSNRREDLVVRALETLSCLTTEEDEVARLRLTGHSYGHRTYERTVRADEVKLLAREGQTAMLLTAQGEEVVRSAVDADGEVLPGFLVVRGLRRNLMDFDAIALVVGRSTAWVRRTWSAAAAKLRASQR